MISAEETIYYEFDNFRLDVENQHLLKDGKVVSLTNKAYLTLLILVRNSGQIVEKEDLMSELWTDSFVEESNLSQYIYTLRKVLGKNGDGNPYIETVTKRGFRFSGKVRQFPNIEPESAVHAPADEFLEQPLPALNGNGTKPGNGTVHNAPVEKVYVQPDAESQPAANYSYPNGALRQTSGKRFAVVAALAILIVCLITAALFYRGGTGEPSLQTKPVASSSGIKSIAVLPFKTIGETNGGDKLGFGMADAFITRLSKLKRIPVRSTSTVFGFFEQPEVDALKAGRDLGVDAILEGTVQREGSRVRVSVKLINVADGKPLWAENFDESAEDIFVLQDSISAKVAQSLELNLTREQEKLLAERATNQPEAFQAYQTGLYFWNKRTRESLETAIKNFNRAIELDPNYARAYAGLADSYNMLFHNRYATAQDAFPKARQAAEKSLSLDNNLADAYMALAYLEVLEKNNMESAAHLLEKAIELSPYNSTIRVRYAWALLENHKLEESVRQARLAQEYDPSSHITNNVLCSFLSFQNKPDEAIPYCEKSVNIAPNAPSTRLVLAKIYFFAGRHDDAIKEMKARIDTVEGMEKDFGIGQLAYFYAKLNRRAEAEEIFNRLEKEVGTAPYHYGYLILTAYTLGKTDKALALFKKAEAKGHSPGITFHYDPIWQDIRGDERFRL
jgi:TolB-like protein/DNA-binding winged helix-turn-helix (wHTH) protein